MSPVHRSRNRFDDTICAVHLVVVWSFLFITWMRVWSRPLFIQVERLARRLISILFLIMQSALFPFFVSLFSLVTAMICMEGAMRLFGDTLWFYWIGYQKSVVLLGTSFLGRQAIIMWPPKYKVLSKYFQMETNKELA